VADVVVVGDVVLVVLVVALVVDVVELDVVPVEADDVADASDEVAASADGPAPPQPVARSAAETSPTAQARMSSTVGPGLLRRKRARAGRDVPDVQGRWRVLLPGERLA